MTAARERLMRASAAAQATRALVLGLVSIAALLVIWEALRP